MLTRLIQAIALLALILAPAAMHAPAEAAPAHHQARGAGHCPGADEAPDEDRGARGADCALACSARPEAATDLEPAPTPRTVYQPSRAAFRAGIAPGSDPPPPRLS